MRDASPRREERRVLRAVHTALHRRADRPGRAEVAYRAYVVVLVGLVVGAPVARVFVGAVRTAVVAEAIAPMAIAIAGAIAALAAVLTGPVRGPVVVSAPALETVVAGPLARRRTLRRPFARSQGALTAVVVVIAALAAISLADAASPTAVIAAVIAAAGLSGVLGILWLLGQSAPRIRRTTATVILGWAVVTLAASAVPSLAPIAVWAAPWGWAQVVWDGLVGRAADAAALIAAGLAVVLGAAGMACAPARRDRLRRDDLSAQAARLSSATALAVSGEVAELTRTVTRPPHGRRDRPWLRARSWQGALVRRDIVGWLRTPGRTAWAVIVCALVGVLWGRVASTGPVVASGAIAVALYLGVGGLCTGVRAAMNGVGGGAVYGVSDGMRMSWHLLMPAVAACVVTGAGALIVGGAVAALWAVGFALLAVMLQAFASLRGPLPVEALTPVPSPVGDLSILNVLVWLSDAVAIAAIVTAAATATGRTFVGLLVLVVGIALAAVGAEGRLRRRARP